MRRWVLFGAGNLLLLAAVFLLVLEIQNRYHAQRRSWRDYLDLKYFGVITRGRASLEGKSRLSEPYTPPSGLYFREEVWELGLAAGCVAAGAFCLVRAYRGLGAERRRARRAFTALLSVLAVAAAALGCYAVYRTQQHDMGAIERHLDDDGAGYLFRSEPLTSLKVLEAWRGEVEALGLWVSGARKQAALERLAGLKKVYRDELKGSGWTEDELRLLD